MSTTPAWMAVAVVDRDSKLRDSKPEIEVVTSSRSLM